MFDYENFQDTYLDDSKVNEEEKEKQNEDRIKSYIYLYTYLNMHRIY